MFNRFDGVLGELGTKHSVHLRLCVRAKGGTIGGASDWHNLAFVVEESNFDDHFALLFNTVLDEVLAVIIVSNLTRNFLLVGSHNFHEESVESRLTVFTEVVSGLDNEFNRLSNSLFFQDTKAECKRLCGAGIHEVAERYPGGSQVTA